MVDKRETVSKERLFCMTLHTLARDFSRNFRRGGGGGGVGDSPSSPYVELTKLYPCSCYGTKGNIIAEYYYFTN